MLMKKKSAKRSRKEENSPDFDMMAEIQQMKFEEADDLMMRMNAVMMEPQ